MGGGRKPNKKICFPPLWQLCKEGQLAMLRRAVAQGEDVNSRDEKNRTTLIWAVGGGYNSIVRLLLKQPRIDVNVKEDQCGGTALAIAADIGNVEIVQLLLATKSLNANSTIKDGEFALTLAARRGHFSVMKLLLSDRRVNVSQTTKFGRTALTIAAFNGHTKVVEQLLMDQRVEVNQNDDFGNSALIFAAFNGHASVVQLLLNDTRVNVNSTNNKGYTALMAAAKIGNQTVVQMLLSDERVNTNLKPVADFKSPTAVEEAVLSPEDVGEAHGEAVDGAVVTKKESCCWNCNTPDHALELMKCKGCHRVRFFQETTFPIDNMSLSSHTFKSPV